MQTRKKLTDYFTRIGEFSRNVTLYRDFVKRVTFSENSPKRQKKHSFSHPEAML